MSRRQKKKALVVEEQTAIEAVLPTEYIYDDTQCVTGVDPEYKWGDIYRLISRREVPDMGLEEEPIYANIERSAIMKVATRPEMFPCSEVMKWILPHTNHGSMLICNVEGQGYASFSPGYVALAYHLPEPQVFLSNEWLDNLSMQQIISYRRRMLDRYLLMELVITYFRRRRLSIHPYHLS